MAGRPRQTRGAPVGGLPGGGAPSQRNCPRQDLWKLPELWTHKPAPTAPWKTTKQVFHKLPQVFILLGKRITETKALTCPPNRGSLKASLRQSDHTIEAESLRHSGASYPRQDRCCAGVYLEHLDRLPGAMVDDIQGVNGAPARFEIQTVGSERVPLVGVERTRTPRVGRDVEPLVWCR